MSDEEFFLTIWKLAAIVLISIVLSVSGCISYTNSRISNAIENGVDPLKASCAFTNEGRSMCTIVATKS